MGDSEADAKRYGALDEDDIAYAVGGLACKVRDLHDIPRKLTKEQFADLARAMANIALCASGSEDVMVDARDDEMAKEAADVILAIWMDVHGGKCERCGRDPVEMSGDPNLCVHCISAMLEDDDMPGWRG